MTRAADLPLPDWPAMMAVETACAYLDLKESSFRVLMLKFGVRPVDCGMALARWRRRDLDALVDRLGPKGLDCCPDATPAPDPADQALERAAQRAQGARRRNV